MEAAEAEDVRSEGVGGDGDGDGVSDGDGDDVVMEDDFCTIGVAVTVGCCDRLIVTGSVNAVTSGIWMFVRFDFGVSPGRGTGCVNSFKSSFFNGEGGTVVDAAEVRPPSLARMPRRVRRIS